MTFGYVGDDGILVLPHITQVSEKPSSPTSFSHDLSREKGMNPKEALAYMLILILLVYGINGVNNQIAANAQSANATTMDVITGDVAPIFLSGLFIIFLGFVIYRFVQGASM